MKRVLQSVKTCVSRYLCKNPIAEICYRAYCVHFVCRLLSYLLLLLPQPTILAHHTLCSAEIL